MAPRSTKTQALNGNIKDTASATGMTSSTTATGNKQTFSFDIVAALLLILRERGVTISRTHYELMSALDGNRTADAFQHQFRAVLARAKALHGQRENGVAFEAVKPMPKGKSKNGSRSKRKKGNRDNGGDGEDEDGSAEIKGRKKKRVPGNGAAIVKSELDTGDDEDASADIDIDTKAGKSPSPGKNPGNSSDSEANGSMAYEPFCDIEDESV